MPGSGCAKAGSVAVAGDDADDVPAPDAEGAGPVVAEIPEEPIPLLLERIQQGEVTQLNWATYLFTREPIAFGEPFQH